jgi:prephenate dehydrogenase
MKDSKNITIVGGKGQMGQLFTRLLSSLGHQVKVLDKEDWADAKNLLAGADLVLVSVPIHETISIIQDLKPYLEQHTVLADLTSLQTEPLKLMLENHLGPVVSLHPMFGPTISSPVNQGIIYSEGRAPVYYQWLLDDLQKLGFILQAMPANKHDNLMNFVQGLEHFNTIALGLFLREQHINIDELNKLASPIYRIKLLLLGRIFDQDATLYTDIMTADKTRLELIENYLKSAQALLKDLQAGKRQEVIENFNQVASYLGDFTNLAQTESDTLLNWFYSK